jgi:hypothetical protein
MERAETSAATQATTPATTQATTPGAAGFGLNPACDVCGQPVTPEDCYTTELTAGGATCPTALTLHHACYEAASSMWVPEAPDSTCTYDPLFPETGQWNLMQQHAEESPR